MSSPASEISDREHMARALRLAARARYLAPPNPAVGCVLVRDGEVVGEGFTQRTGKAHAEVVALAAAGDRAAGATAFVTLEPCSHHGRTPPCAEALVQARVSRVVAALEDPNPQVAGRGLKRLREAGVAVEVGLLGTQAEALMRGFVLRMRRGWGRVRLKVAMSLDGRSAMASGESQWITGPDARADVQRLRAQSCAIVTGAGTVLADDCALTLRPALFAASLGLAAPPGDRQPLRVVLDSRRRVPASARVLSADAPTLLLHACGATGGELPRHAERAELPPAAGGGLDLPALLQLLATRECNEILVESGPTLAGAFLRQGLVDELVVYMAPRLLGSRARPVLELPLDRMADVLQLQPVDQRQVGGDWRFTFIPRNQE
jgi:diaminohydroxyphosphoribosylaminopyrimidine deaminase/5-amino-6-(5-phosphoribosylamino)uracil reductase